MLEINTRAPEFNVLDDQSSHVTLETLLATTQKYLLLYFYPRDNTPGCTVEAETMRDMMNELRASKITVVGVSTDSVESHKKFKEKFNLPFTLLADTDKEIIKKYQVASNFGTAKRASYLINKSGEIIKHYEKVSPANHASQVIEDVARLK